MCALLSARAGFNMCDFGQKITGGRLLPCTILQPPLHAIAVCALGCCRVAVVEVVCVQKSTKLRALVGVP